MCHVYVHAHNMTCQVCKSSKIACKESDSCLAIVRLKRLARSVKTSARRDVPLRRQAHFCIQAYNYRSTISLCCKRLAASAPRITEYCTSSMAQPSWRTMREFLGQGIVYCSGLCQPVLQLALAYTMVAWRIVWPAEGFKKAQWLLPGMLLILCVAYIIHSQVHRSQPDFPPPLPGIPSTAPAAHASAPSPSDTSAMPAHVKLLIDILNSR